MLDYLPWFIDMSNLEYWAVGIVVAVSIVTSIVCLFWLGYLVFEAGYYDDSLLWLKRLLALIATIIAIFMVLSGIKSYGLASDQYDYQGAYLDSSVSTVSSLAIVVRQPGEGATVLKDGRGPIEVTVAIKGNKGSISSKVYLCRATECSGLTVGQPIGWLVYRPYGDATWHLLPPGASR
ncbi:hypothetical protein IPM09_02895 [Candidatus Saccharibacteria bacterium]|nr:MAG: hypothetical protein IPM09_02895 [Candidatus Saccharibacteria bacterium]